MSSKPESRLRVGLKSSIRLCSGQFALKLSGQTANCCVSAPAIESISASFRVVHVFPDSARLSCGPCNAIMAFMESQLQQGLDFRAISPSDHHIPVERRQPIEHLPITEFDLETADACDVALAAA